MFILMVVVFVLGYTAIALEHPIKVDKAASALLIGVLTWTIYVLNSTEILNLGFSPSWASIQERAHDLLHYVKPNLPLDKAGNPDMNPGWMEILHIAHDPIYFVKHELAHHLVEIAEILFFLLGAMTIVEIVDQHEGFRIITDKIKTIKRSKLLWVISILAFFMSAALDNLTTTIVMIALLRKLMTDQKDRWTFASMVVIAANAGGAWSPIGDVTTIMLWIGGQITAGSIIIHVIVPSIVTMVVPVTIMSMMMKGNVSRPVVETPQEHVDVPTTSNERMIVFLLGVGSLLFVPVFKTVTHLPPYMGMLLGLGNMWLVTEIMHRRKNHQTRSKLTVVGILKKIDTATIFFFMGILVAVAALQSAGQLALLSNFLDENLGNIYAVNLAIGVLSAIVDNVPLVAGAMGMYDIYTPDMLQALGDSAAMTYYHDFQVDGIFWEFLAYCAGTGGSILIIGSAAGVAAMGLEKIDFIWYLKKMSLLALIGYLAGAATYYAQVMLFY
ncbi:MAG: sodium:proton antiporter NhaD [Bacteroidales bacterium]|nr:sodium:proton antiporter NhaD [Bacteroidales bacterium]